MGNNNTKWKTIRIILWIIFAVYTVIVVIVGKCYAERFAAAKIAESRLEAIREGIDDNTLDDIIDDVIRKTIGDNIAGSVISGIVSGDNINVIYHALVDGMEYKVYAVEKTSEGKYRIGVIIENNDNILVTKQAVELIKESYSGGDIGDFFNRLRDDISGGITNSLSDYFERAAKQLEQDGLGDHIREKFVITVDPNAKHDMPEVENENGMIGFIMTCAGFPSDVGRAPAITDQRGQYGIIFFVLLGIDIIGCACIIILSIKFRKKEPAGNITYQTTDAVSAVIPEDRTAILYAHSPQHNNMMFAVHDTPIVIGRDAAECKVVFAQDSVGVSSRHCSIYYDKGLGAFVLTDLGSTYGTYLNNGERLTPDRPYSLHPGDGFYTGDPVNKFSVNLG